MCVFIHTLKLFVKFDYEKSDNKLMNQMGLKIGPLVMSSVIEDAQNTRCKGG